jgi:hypothetical protein
MDPAKELRCAKTLFTQFGTKSGQPSKIIVKQIDRHSMALAVN